MIILIFLHFFNIIHATYVISVYGDVYKDREFFTKTYPWVIDNIGGEIVVDYYLLGSGRYSVPQMCALNEMRSNTFLQARYLQCEAEGTPSCTCLWETGIDLNKFKQCVLTKGSLASFASSKYTQLGLDASPVVEIGPRNTVFEVKDNWYLKKICTIFGDSLPRGCIYPFSCNQTDVINGRSIAFLNCDGNNCDGNIPTTTTSTSTSGYTSTSVNTTKPLPVKFDYDLSFG